MVSCGSPESRIRDRFEAGPLDDAELAQRLEAEAEGVSLTGPEGLGGLTKRVLETALEGELDEHLRYARHDPAGRSTPNSRNESDRRRW